MREDFDTPEFRQQVIKSMKKRLDYYKTLEKYTKKSLKLKDHREAVKFMEKVIQETLEEYGMEEIEYEIS